MVACYGSGREEFGMGLKVDFQIWGFGFSNFERVFFNKKNDIVFPLLVSVDLPLLGLSMNMHNLLRSK